MSTFKVQPVYAELIMGWLSCAEKEVGGVTWAGVLTSVAWKFKGGEMGAYPAAHPTPCSSTYFPHGNTAEILAQGEHGRDMVALRRIVRTQMAEKKRARAAQAAWVHSYALMHSVRREMGAGSQCMTGLSAVYAVLRHLWGNMPPRSTVSKKLMAYLREVSMASASASHLDADTIAALVASVGAALGNTPVVHIRSHAKQADRIMRYAMSRAASRNSRSRGSAIYDGRDLAVEPGDLRARRYELGGIHFWVTSGCAVGTIRGATIALSISDLQRLRTFLVGASSGLFATVTQACTAPGPERQKAADIGATYVRQVNRLLNSTRRVPLGDEVKVCKGYKRAFGAYLGELCGPLCRAETRDLWEEADSTVANGALDTRGWVEELRKWTVNTAFNLGKVYKLCPAPDASPGGTMLERHEMIGNRNSISAPALDLFKDELRAQILRAYIQTPGVRLEPRGAKPAWWDQYLAKQWDYVPSDEIHEWLKWEGTAIMPRRSPDDPAVWKDSGLGYDTMAEGLDPDRSRLKGNMLTRMVFDPAIPMPGVRHSGHEIIHKVDIKPEGYKDPARAIYSGNIRDRLNQSWMEQAVEEVCKSHPSFMIGAGPTEREERTRMVVDRPERVDHVALYYSFDISGWSPRMPPETQRASHEIWAELYDEDLFRDAWKITEGSCVYMNKGGYQAWYVNNGANFEGYNGKEMTMILITLMSLSVKLWRRDLIRAGLATREEARQLSAGLLAYIDDGLAKLVLPAERAVPRFNLYKATCVRVFQAMGYTIEPSKCYPSDRFAIFLNESYLMGRHVAHGTRAAMTLNAENTEEHTTLIERASAAIGGCGGAVMAGLDALAGHMLMCYTLYMHIEEWVPRNDPVLSAIWTCMPRALGGLGAPTVLQLGTSGSGAALEEGLRTMQCAASMSPVWRNVFLRKVRDGLRERSAGEILAAPLGGTAKSGVMTASRVGPVVRKSLVRLASRGVLSPLARTFLRYGEAGAREAYAEAVVPVGQDKAIQEQILLDLQDAHPSELFMKFTRRLEKSSTLLRLAGGRELGRMVRANRQDVLLSYNNLRLYTQI